MIKAVFFDLYHTLVGYAPPREETEAAALKTFGIEVTPAALLRPLVMADVRPVEALYIGSQYQVARLAFGRDIDGQPFQRLGGGRGGGRNGRNEQAEQNE